MRLIACVDLFIGILALTTVVACFKTREQIRKDLQREEQQQQQPTDISLNNINSATT
ncbi:hypothetical protein I4U23_022194 [Adineta vaga]|nr:hypothetical protein I4U23_022194 [Adineta vaga]